MRKENSTDSINEKALQQYCNASKTLALFSGRWKLSLLFKLFEGETHYHEFKLFLPQISDRILTKQLNELQERGLVTKEKTKTSSIYSLTAKSKELESILFSLSSFKN